MGELGYCLFGKENGGLGVRKIREFNLSWLGKWCRRMYVGQRSLKYKVLVSKYGQKGG